MKAVRWPDGFLNGELEEEVYVRPPPGAERLAVGNKRVLRLCRALYGLKQASRAWNKHLEGDLRAKGFEQSDADPALWILRWEGQSLLCFMWTMAWRRQKLQRRRML
jgi:hypothetical protein